MEWTNMSHGTTEVKNPELHVIPWIKVQDFTFHTKPHGTELIPSLPKHHYDPLVANFIIRYNPNSTSFAKYVHELDPGG
jgi:hypothetical protein